MKFKRIGGLGSKFLEEEAHFLWKISVFPYFGSNDIIKISLEFSRETR